MSEKLIRNDICKIQTSQYNDIEAAFEEAVCALDEIPQFMALSGRARAEKMLQLLDNPHHRLKIIHVAGTNGKGSVCAYLERILRENGYKTGLFTSPHLLDIRERIQINGKMIEKADFLTQYAQVRSADSRLQEEGVGLAYFDYFLGIALLTFVQEQVDFVVMETGLGGRLDATNAVDNPILTILTAISLEHTQILGDTVKAIAAEKAGIIKQGVPVVYWAGNEAAASVIAQAADNVQAPAVSVDEGMYEILKNTGKRIDFSVHNGYYKNDCFSITTGAVYQAQNCTLALTAAAVLQKYANAALKAGQCREAVLRTFWAGRMEEICTDVYVDGAHNPDGIEQLIRSVPAISKKRPVILLFSVVRDKNYENMIKRLCTCGVFDSFCITQLEGKRKLSKAQIQTVFKQYTAGSVAAFDDVQAAYEHAAACRQKQDAVLICTGSLYLVGRIKAIAGCGMVQDQEMSGRNTAE